MTSQRGRKEMVEKKLKRKYEIVAKVRLVL